MKQIMDLQYLGYPSGPSRNLDVKERWIVMDGEKEREKGEGRGGRQGVGYRSSETDQIC